MMKNSLNFKSWAVAAGLLLLAGTAAALDSDQRQPIEIQADNAMLDQARQVTVFGGNVVVQQGSIDIRAAKIEVSRSDSGQQTMLATGNPVRFKQQLDDGKGWVNGQASRVTYQSASGVVTLSGNAKVTRGGDVVQGNQITYNTKTEIYTAAGHKAASSSGDRRVTVILQPSSKQAGKP